MKDTVQDVASNIMSNEGAARDFLIMLGTWIGAPLLAVFCIIGIVSVINVVMKKVSG
jgi:hypothetical protein